MADDLEKKEETKAKRGRPRKGPIPDPEINEKGKTLEMSVSNTATLQQVQDNLHGLYSDLLGHVSRNDSWIGTLNDLNKYNPFLQNQRLKMINAIPGSMSREDLASALEAPQNSEQPLRSQGTSLAASQYLYYKILRLSADVPMFKYYKVPELIKESEYKSDKFINEDKFVDEWLEKFDIVNTLKRISLEVKREGKPTYVLRNSIVQNGGMKHVNYCTMQKLPTDYIKLIGIGEHGYIASFNMMIFLNPAFLPSQYPDFIQDIWDDMVVNHVVVEATDKKGVVSLTPDINKLRDYSYKYQYDNGNVEELHGILEMNNPRNIAKKAYMYWVPMPQDLCYTFCSDTSNPWALPDTAGLFLGLQELTDYDTLAGLIQSTPLTALLTAEAETISNPNAGQDQTVLNGETIAGFQEKFNTMTSTNLEAFFAPFKNFKLLSLPNVPNSTDITTKATQNFIMRAGLGGIISTTEKPSVSQVKAAQNIIESECDFVTQQIASVLNMIVNKLIGNTYKWKLIIWGSIFSFADEVKRDKELFIAGCSFVLPKLLSSYNLNTRDARAQELYINSFDIYKDLKTITQEQQLKSKEIDAQNKNDSAGRPSKDDNDVDNDNTAASKESGLDTVDMRDFALKCHENCTCMLCGSFSDNILCDECRDILNMEE